MPNRKVLDGRVAGTQLELPSHPRINPVEVKSLIQNRLCVEAAASVVDALKLMAGQDAGAVLVVEGGRPVGVFSERDYVRASMQLAMPGAMAVREVMSPFAMSADVSESLQQCVRLMLENRLRYLPILEGTTPVGLLSLDGALQAMVAYLERVFKESEMDKQIVNLSGTYSC